MARLVFRINFASRSAKSPTDDGYTYHHILPWRYYYAAGVILAQVARRMIVGLSFNETSGRPRFNAKALQAATQELDSAPKLVAAYGTGHEDFRNELVASTIKAFDLLNLCRSMHRTGATVNVIDASLKAAGGFHFGAIGNLCGAPLFGGFLGMLREHRRDDPGDAPEQHRAYSVDQTQWAALQLLATHLHAFCPELSGVNAGSTIEANVDADTFKLFKANLDMLVAKHNRRAVFEPADWTLAANGLHAWEYIVNATSVTNTSAVGPVMQIRTSPTQPGGSVVAQVADAVSRYRIFSPIDNLKGTLSFVNDPRSSR